MEELKNRLENFRKNLEEIHTDSNHQISLTINGHFKVTNLKIEANLAHKDIEKSLPDLFSKAIESIGNQIRKKLEEMQTVPH
jgi:DNA-binding protein YbaB